MRLCLSVMDRMMMIVSDVLVSVRILRITGSKIEYVFFFPDFELFIYVSNFAYYMPLFTVHWTHFLLGLMKSPH